MWLCDDKNYLTGKNIFHTTEIDISLIIRDDIIAESTNAKKKKSVDPMKLIGTEKKGVKKKLRKLKKQKAAEHSSKAKAVKLAVGKKSCT